MTASMREATDEISAALTHSTLEIALPKDTPVVSYSDAISEMTVSDLDAYIAVLKDRADRQRVPMPYEEAKAIVEATWIHPWAEKSVMAPVIQCRVALRRTLEAGHHHPQQLRDVFLTIARERTESNSIAIATVDCAIRDAAANRSRGPVSHDY